MVVEGGEGTRQGQGTGGFPFTFFLHPFHTACLPSTPTVASDPEAPAAPHPGSGKSLSSMLLWVARFSQAEILGFAGYLCISFIYTLLRPRTSFFLQSSLFSSSFSWRDGSSSRTKYLCLSQFQGN